jgi:hypothetical protein
MGLFAICRRTAKTADLRIFDKIQKEVREGDLEDVLQCKQYVVHVVYVVHVKYVRMS